MSDWMTLVVVAVAFGVGFFAISALIDFVRKIKASRPTLTAPGGTPEREFLGHVGFMAKALALADGPINPRELAVLSGYIDSQAAGDALLKSTLLEVIGGPTKSALSIEYHAEHCRRLKAGDPAALAGLIRFLDELAACDGPITPKEAALLNAARKALQQPP